ncbi:iron-sulfur cluster assembly scaffold protein [Desulfonatronospira sp.]|uniref:iron-sulfur cluster assembly scaffold protein n=1 Tax=Desulfonatronospira sp. TaxID=1962951 RepID=UPI0025BFED8B|nr:iron-sulfur cluster assembly scaffold protein [Desulfonatronospira sp.]
MDESMHRAFDELQHRVDSKVLQDFGPEIYRRWKNPDYMGRMQNYDCMAAVTGSCGNRVEIYLGLEQGVISRTSFFSQGCGASVVCASMTCELAMSRTLDQALDLEPGDVMLALPGMPESKRHYASLAVKALHRAIEKCG